MKKEIKIAENLERVHTHTHTHTSLLKNKRGAITLYVTIACLFILIIRNSELHRNKQQTSHTTYSIKRNRKSLQPEMGKQQNK